MNDLADILVVLFDECNFANAVMAWGSPGPIKLPDDADERRKLIQAHVNGSGTIVTYCPSGKPERVVEVNPCVLSALCPAADGLARWAALDLDGDNHGDKGLASPMRVLLCLAERADRFGLLPGLLANRSKSGKGYHVWLILPEPTPLADAVAGVSAWAAAAWRVAASDVQDGGLVHAFTTVSGKLALPGECGSAELFPRGDTRPERGWPLTLPAAGAYAEQGGQFIDPFAPHVELKAIRDIPRCPPDAWADLVRGARMEMARGKVAQLHTRPSANRPRRPDPGNAIDRIDDRTRQFIEGKASPGGRNQAAFSATCNLLGCGVDPADAEKLILDGASLCGLPEKEAIAAIKSACKAVNR